MMPTSQSNARFVPNQLLVLLLCAATLVHCGAGVSRSAALVMAYLMRRFAWNAAKARQHCVERRSVVQPNDGFWRSLCAFEAQLGIGDRWACRGSPLRVTRVQPSSLQVLSHRSSEPCRQPTGDYARSTRAGSWCALVWQIDSQ